ncbi:MAG: hypothetical protein A3I78_02720 [Gammaproteobacteria bacterium RIFCSPLOWO2_02_FULL_56_15]|nr:MAG: hypothetical protein A3I78_02720 [Gammaproteobacteria bacterium RIFCSPLOWO2_02_FULL_56_15]
MSHLTKGSVFDYLELEPGEAEQLKIKAALFDTIIDYMKKNNLTQQRTADVMGVQRSRIGDICRGKITGFSIDSLVAMTARAGLHPLQVAA